jgi:hypothetical protein
VKPPNRNLPPLTLALCAFALACGGRSSLFEDSPPIEVSVGGSRSGAGEDAGLGAGLRDARAPSDDGAVSVLADDASPADDAAATAPDDAAVGPYGALPSPAACLTGGNVLWVDGDVGSWWLDGTQTVSSKSVWLGYADSFYATFGEVTLSILGSPGVADWDVSFNTWTASSTAPGAITATPLQVGIVYPVRYSNFTQQIAITGPTGLCNPVEGAFRLDEFTAQNDPNVAAAEQPLLTLTAVFYVSCENSPVPSAVLRGCVHFDASNPQNAP